MMLLIALECMFESENVFAGIMASEQDLHAGPSSSSQAEPRSREWEEFREFCRPLIKAIRNGVLR